LGGAALGTQLPLWSAAPFVVLLVLVAVLELVARRWWGRVANKILVAAALAGPAALQLLVGYGSDGGVALWHSMTDYVSFILLLTAMFVIAGGIEVKGSLAGTPLANMTMLGIGAVLANLIGTTGAAMVLIRPFLRANAKRRHKAHLVVFFILIVANTGGLLTPLGDPPLYLGFLKGVPFGWSLGMWGPWLVVNGAVLVIFNLVDQFVVNREERERGDDGLFDELMVHEPLRLVGGWNVAFLAAVVLVILGRGSGFGHGGESWPFGVQELLLCGIAAASYLTTARAVHESNAFSFGPITSVAIVFFGIFVTMTAPLLILNARGAELGLREPWHFFWASGGVSSVLDNAPTYLSFTAVAAGQLGLSSDDPTYLSALVATPAGDALLVAISCGAVLMGCLTYIGNGPNLMVKEMAEERGVGMPHFFAYAIVAVAIMVPVFAATTFLFFPP
jgi:Na+/H+ antiporter NhaD/arsenite permease-like protein